MSASGPKRTSVFAPHMSAFGGKADMPPLATGRRGKQSNIETSLHAPTPKKENFLNVDRRLAVKIRMLVSNLGAPETPQWAETLKRGRLFGRSQARNRETRLGGWRSSAHSALLCPFSQLTGNFTGNFNKN